MKKSSDPAYLSASEAAAELSVSQATLYAYVSRGMVRSEPNPEGPGKRYRADDVRALRGRRAPPGDEPARGGEALAWGTPVLDSAISLIAADGLFYRGASAIALSETATLEHVACLLWDVSGADPFTDDFQWSEKLDPVLRAVADARPIDRVGALMPLAIEHDPLAFNRTRAGRVVTGARILRMVAQLIAGASPSRDPVHRVLARAWCPKHKHGEDLIRRALVLLADHELNASAFAARVVASTGTSLYDVVAAGLAALKGPRHGGAASRAARLVKTLSSGDLRAEIRERVALGERFPGFGHPLYPGGDPRAVALLGALAKAGADPRFVEELPHAITASTGEAANIDFALAVLGQTLSLPQDSGMAIFALARTAGWIAHAIEQGEGGSLIRPRARYTGPAPRG